MPAMTSIFPKPKEETLNHSHLGGRGRRGIPGHVSVKALHSLHFSSCKSALLEVRATRTPPSSCANSREAEIVHCPGMSHSSRPFQRKPRPSPGGSLLGCCYRPLERQAPTSTYRSPQVLPKSDQNCCHSHPPVSRLTGAQRLHGYPGGCRTWEPSWKPPQGCPLLWSRAHGASD